VTILTVAGEAFIDGIDAQGFDFFSPRGYDKIYREGKKVLSNLIDIPVPVIAALNGPANFASLAVNSQAPAWRLDAASRTGDASPAHAFFSSKPITGPADRLRRRSRRSRTR
jgi:hypothetical protein